MKPLANILIGLGFFGYVFGAMLTESYTVLFPSACWAMALAVAVNRPGRNKLNGKD